MPDQTQLFIARKALVSDSWETRYQGLEMLTSIGEASDIERIEMYLTDPFAPVRIMALQALSQLLAIESEDAIRRCLFDNDADDPYGSLEVRNAARSTLDAILQHTRPVSEVSLAGNLL